MLGAGEVGGVDLLVDPVGLVLAPERVSEDCYAARALLDRAPQRPERERGDLEGGGERVRQRLRSHEPASCVERAADGELGEVQREAPVEVGVEASVVVAAQAVGARRVAFAHVGIQLESWPDLGEQAVKDALEDLGLAELRRVSGAILELVGEKQAAADALSAREGL